MSQFSLYFKPIEPLDKKKIPKTIKCIIKQMENVITWITKILVCNLTKIKTHCDCFIYFYFFNLYLFILKIIIYFKMIGSLGLLFIVY